MLTSHGPLTAIVGERIYWMRLPQGAVLPAVTYSRVSWRAATGSHDGGSPQNDLRWQLTAWGAKDNDSAARAAAVEIFAALEGKGDGGNIVRCLKVGDVDLSEPETQRWMRVQDFSIWAREAA